MTVLDENRWFEIRSFQTSPSSRQFRSTSSVGRLRKPLRQALLAGASALMASVSYILWRAQLAAMAKSLTAAGTALPSALLTDLNVLIASELAKKAGV